MFIFGRAWGLVVPMLALAVASHGCSPGTKSPELPSETGSGGSTAGTGMTTGGGLPIGGSDGAAAGRIGTGGGVPLAGTGATGSGGMDIVECAGDRVMGMALPVDVYVMLDISKSMLATTGTGVSKWDAVKEALAAFFNDAGSGGLNVAIQFFPLRKPDVPATCMASAECGAGAPCTFSSATTGICEGFSSSRGIAQCEDAAGCENPVLKDDGPCAGGFCALTGAACADDAACRVLEMGSFGPCGPLGACTSDPARPCVVGALCGPSDPCVAAPSGLCMHRAFCDPAAYRVPAVEFAELPANAAALTAAIEAQMPDGDTPQRPALRGAIDHAREWTASHPDHSVVVVLATDGLASECSTGSVISGSSPTAVADVVAVATEGLQGTPSIQTFVVGVFAATDTAAPTNLNSIAMAGGTEQAYIVDTGSDVKAQFLAALNEIRAAHLDCEFAIPDAPPGKTLSYSEVNVQISEAGVTTPFFYVPNGCTGLADEWHYDVTPSATATPTKIVTCPATCEAIKTRGNATVDIQLGCMQDIR